MIKVITSKERQSIYFKQWYEKKKKDKEWYEKHCASSRRYYKNNKEKVIEYNKMWAALNPGIMKKYQQENYKKHKERISKYKKKYYELHKDKYKNRYKTYGRTYFLEHKDEINAWRRARYAKRKALTED